MCLQMRQHMDGTAQVAADNSKYARRLKKIMAKKTGVNGVPLNCKVSMRPSSTLTLPLMAQSASVPVSWTPRAMTGHVSCRP